MPIIHCIYNRVSSERTIWQEKNNFQTPVTNSHSLNWTKPQPATDRIPKFWQGANMDKQGVTLAVSNPLCSSFCLLFQQVFLEWVGHGETKRSLNPITQQVFPSMTNNQPNSVRSVMAFHSVHLNWYDSSCSHTTGSAQGSTPVPYDLGPVPSRSLAWHPAWLQAGARKKRT